MEDGTFTPSFVNFSDNTMDLDFMEELLFEGCWLETTDGFNFSQQDTVTSSVLNDTNYLLTSEVDTDRLGATQHHQIYQQETEYDFPENRHLVLPKMEELLGTQTENYVSEGAEPGKRLWIGPRADPGPSSSVKERLIHAIGYMQECTKDSKILVQLWVPIKKRGKYVLTTNDQPYFLDPNCKSLANYRNVSTAYQFPAEEDSKDLAGLPGRVYLGRLPEWTPDVHFFRSDEYPRINHAQQYDVHGSLALPVFEVGSKTCLGVIEIVMTTQKANYLPELENVCKALKAVDLRSLQKLNPPSVQACSDLYQVVLPEIKELLTSVCKMHRLPLALTWAPCIRQGKGGCRHSDENYARCVSSVDSAYFVADDDILKFHDACSEHHLLLGQGIVGRAFMTNKPCFATDVTAFSKTDYPLSHHARMFNLRAAVAVPLLSIYNESAEFVVEFFLPKDCQDTEEQRRMVNSFFVVAQGVSRMLRVVEKELEEITVSLDGRLTKLETQKWVSPPPKETSTEGSSWIADMMNAQQKGKGVSVSLEHQKEEPNEDLRVTTPWNNGHVELRHLEFGKLKQTSGVKISIEGGVNSSSSGGGRSLGDRKAGDKRRTKTEKTISLQALRQYFAGSLKDAAKSLGVCPTTLKRICRNHGINRWPSRKIKKVGHSLKKLQLVIDSVQGAEGAIQIGSFYTSFPELSSPNFSGGTPPFPLLKTNDSPKQLNPQPGHAMFIPVAATSQSPSSSGSQSSSSSLCCSTGAKQNISTINGSNGEDALATENPVGLLKRACSDDELHALNPEETKILARSESHKAFGEHPNIETLIPPLPKNSGPSVRDGGTFRVKATFGEEKIRFSMQPNSCFRNLQVEIARRLNIEDINKLDLKYLDDDHEWILLTCDDDLDECIDICRASKVRTIKLSLHHPSHPSLGSSFGSSDLS